MNLFTSKEFHSLQELFLDQIRDLYDAEQRLIDALPKMAESAATPALRTAFESHLQETRNHAVRLESIFREMGVTPKRETCLAMKGIVEEGSQMVSAKGNTAVKDAALIAAAQRVEHYEMAGYGTARTFALQLDLTEAARLLGETLKEEKAANEKLTQVAEGDVNQRAAAAAATWN